MTKTSGIEFAICTYNRSTYLKGCVEALLGQMVPGKTRLTVIDNNSTDDTKRWVIEKMGQYDSLRYLSESKQGLSHARNTAWRHASFTWVLYLDDDCLPTDGFVCNALDLIGVETDVDAFGGPIEPLYIGAVPEWLPAGFGSFNMPYTHMTPISNGFIRGGCFMIRQSILEKLNGFNTGLGLKGNELRYGEEIEIQVRMRKAGYTIAYAPSLHVGHFVRMDKMNMKWILQSEYARRRDKMLIEPVSLSMAMFHLVRTILGRLFWIPVHFIASLFIKTHSVQEAVYRSFKPLAYTMGELAGILLNKRKSQ